MKKIKKEISTGTLTYTPFKDIDKLLKEAAEKKDKKEDKEWDCKK